MREFVPAFGRDKGLTLIELVVVCAIIAVLVGIIWVVTAPAREKTRQAVCISNLRQIGHAFRMYRDDWGGVEPQKGVQLEYWQLGLPPTKPPIYTFRPYLKNLDIWYCPSGFLVPTPGPHNYLPNYCTHFDVEIGISPKYDVCPLFPGTRRGSFASFGPFASFKRMVAFHPDLPILYCDTHNYFYIYKGIYWEDKFYFGVILADFSVRRFNWYEYEPLPE